MKQKNENPFLENAANKDNKPKHEDQILYSLLFSGKISLKEYFEQINRRA